MLKESPSIRNIISVIKPPDDLGFTRSYTLGKWAKEGVLLLNTCLTVEKSNPKSHRGWGWEHFIAEILTQLNNRQDNIIFMFWGKEAQSFTPSINKERHYVLEAEHPAAAAHKKRGWQHNNCFNEANRILREMGDKEITWNIF